MQLVAEVEILYSQGLSMIGKRKRHKGCCVGLKDTLLRRKLLMRLSGS